MFVCPSSNGPQLIQRSRSHQARNAHGAARREPFPTACPAPGFVTLRDRFFHQQYDCLWVNDPSPKPKQHTFNLGVPIL